MTNDHKPLTSRSIRFSGGNNFLVTKEVRSALQGLRAEPYAVHSWPTRSMGNYPYLDFGTFLTKTPVEFTRSEKESCSQPIPSYEEVLR